MTIKQQIVSALLVILLFVIFWFSIFGDKGYLDLTKIKNEKDVLTKQNNALIDKNIILYRKIKRLKTDPKYVESIARQELGMIGENELILKFSKKNK